MKNLKKRERQYVLSRPEQIHEKIVLLFCLLFCIGFFIKIVFL